ncbi:hypothetical protein FPSE_10897 [Fusarium pseudograminearum CS3096]|uniref:Uncharacterized protein n=1 Tax=Fusarium pseudograminearum (strain CS3096) TaxID=1028729 RepID=K3VXH7_FUSPC|nr:hypothetical protein FPSE_10897 [Fusarium pseudograminearum CS3096]EKJ68920.1 hypothetical protein FPSE_10897 [Fusarium pseudograminearum CS3096]KAF0638244.1 hypothetical protein FPSE5266_10897 [Fusarium pseudograminearum]
MSSSEPYIGPMAPPTTSQAEQTDHRPDSPTSDMNTSAQTEETTAAPEPGDSTTDSIVLTRKSDPRHDGRYIILDVSRSRALTCHDGYLRFEAIDLNIPHRHVSDKVQWECKERGGFRGFKNVAGGGFLGHDIWWDFYAKAYQHNGWEDFTLWRREDGLCWIQSLDWSTQRQVSAREEGNGLFRQDDGGTLWEFVKVGN